MIDWQTEKLLPLRQVPTYLDCKGGNKVHYSTVFRWATKGARGRVLETQLLGGVRYTSIAAIDRFFDRRATPQDATSDALRQTLYGDRTS